jgi:DNA modification methylase
LTPYYSRDGITIYHGDCRDILPHLPKVDLVLTDPPYGKMWTKGKHAIGRAKHTNETDKTPWDVKPNTLTLRRVLASATNQIVFGGQYFTDILPPSNCWLVWDKRGTSKVGGDQVPFADCELAWTSFNKTVKKYTLVVQGFVSESNDVRVHPTQKPSEIMRHILRDFSSDADLILDPFMGSGTTLVAAKQLGRRAIGIEIEEKYCKIAVERLAQGVLGL